MRDAAWFGRCFDRALQALAIVLAASLVIAAWHDVSRAYDVWYYHVPFAGRLVGLLDAKAYVFSADNAARFAGFPLLGELLQGVLWRVSDHVTATNLVSLSALFGLAAFLWRFFAVPLHISLISLLAIPLVQTHATSSYVDLPANACAAMLILGVHRSIAERPTLRFLAGCCLLAAAAANTKFQLVPVVTVAFGALVVLAVLRRWGARALVVLAIMLPLVFATPIKNTIVHRNPVWPVAISVLGHSFPHVEEAYGSSPRHLADSSRPARFLRSALEVDNRPIASRRRWSVDQWTPTDEPAYRMGGYFGAYVVLNLAAFAWAVFRRRPRGAVHGAPVTRHGGIVFGTVTVVAAFVPQSHELRYYMHWMLVLVCMNLVFWTREARSLVGGVALVAFAIVAWSTGAGYLYASGITFQELLASQVDRTVIESARPGARLCVARQPFSVLYAPIFQTKKDYTVQEAMTDADCKN